MRASLQALLLLVVSSALALGVAEIVLRVRYGPPVHFRFPQETYVHDDEIGHWLAPRQRSFTHDEPVATNSVGLRDREQPRRLPPGVRRILALGDSQTYGEGLELADTWPKQLQRLLRERALGWWVLNGGVSATDTWQHERILRRLLEMYDLDTVVLAVYANDIARATPIRPFEPRNNTPSRRFGYLLKRSAVFTFAWSSYQFAFQGRENLEQLVVAGGHDPRTEPGWEQAAASLAAMREMCDAAGIRFIVAVLPRRDQVSGDEPSRTYQERLAEITGRLGIEFVDLLPPLARAYPEHGQALFIPWDGHNSELANAVVAETLVGRLHAAP